MSLKIVRFCLGAVITVPLFLSSAHAATSLVLIPDTVTEAEDAGLIDYTSCPTEFLIAQHCPTPEELQDPSQPYNQAKCKRYECTENVDGIDVTFRFCAGKCTYPGESCQASYDWIEPGWFTIGRCTCKKPQVNP